MIRKIILVVTVSILMFSTVSAKEMSKGGGYSFCKSQLKIKHPNMKVDTKLFRVKSFKSRKKSREGVTHKIILRVTGLESSGYRAICVITRDQDDYTAVISKLD